MHDIQVPKMGMSTTEVDVVQWLVGVGDVVRPGTPLVEVESEKASTVLESDISGTVSEIVVAAGDIAEVGSVVCRIEPLVV